MPLVQLKSPYQTWRGKSGDTVAYPVNNRMFAREFVIPSNPDDANQQSVRSNLATVAVAFQSLTPAEKAAWANLGSQMTRTDANGDSYTLSAVQAYVSVNSLRLLDGQASTDTAPSFTTALAPTITSITTDSIDVFVNLASTVVGILYYAQVSPPLPGETRNAYLRDLTSISAAPNQANSIVAAGSTTMTMTIPVTDLPFSLASSDRIGLKITAISTGYVKGQSVFDQSIVIG